MQHVATTHCKAVHTSDDRLLEPFDGVVHFESWQHACIQQRIFHAVLSTAGAKKTVACASDYEYPGAGFTPDSLNAIANLQAHCLGEHVPVFWTVQC
ncbi:hypothetical protein D3C87_1812520 [compost metagenome]